MVLTEVIQYLKILLPQVVVVDELLVFHENLVVQEVDDFHEVLLVMLLVYEYRDNEKLVVSAVDIIELEAVEVVELDL